MAQAYSLEQQNVGRAHAGLCHASSSMLFLNLFPFIFQYAQVNAYSHVSLISITTEATNCSPVVSLHNHTLLLHVGWK